MRRAPLSRSQSGSSERTIDSKAALSVTGKRLRVRTRAGISSFGKPSSRSLHFAWSSNSLRIALLKTVARKPRTTAAMVGTSCCSRCQ
jgi:hypothetical protein